ncbi:MAG: FecR family protein [Steroidobacteraceae bacterium]
MKAAELLYDYDEGRWLEALDWHALRCSADGLTPPQQDAWRHWTLDPENRRVYAACAQLYRDAQGLEDSEHMARISAPRASRKSPDVRQVVKWALAGATLAVCAASALLVIPRARPTRIPSAPVPTSVASTVYRSPPGQTHRIRLGDGSTVVLGAETVLDVIITPQRRSLNLRRGEAWFDVIHRPHWPFVVTAGTGQIRDLGTAFVVDREAGRTEVTVTQGQVEVSLSGMLHAPLPETARLQPIRLHRGERFVYGTHIRLAIRHVSPRLALGWTRGHLEFIDEPLGVVAENISRYSQQPIRVSPAAAGLHLTTLVLSHHIRAWIQGLSRVLPVVAVYSNGDICVRLQTSLSTHKANDCREP